MHNLTVDEETDRGVTFACSICGAVCEFVKPEAGNPNPVMVDGVWMPPENPEQWMGPCTS